MAEPAPDTTLVEAIKLVGGIAGLVTAAFVIWDRWVRGRPLAWVTAKKLVVGASSSYEYIRLQNPGPVGVFIKRVRAYPPIYGIAKDHSAGAITRAVVKFDVNVLLGPSDTHDLVIVPLRDPSKVPKDEPSRWVCFLIYWRKTSSSWLPQVPVPVMTSTHDIQRIAAAAP